MNQKDQQNPAALAQISDPELSLCINYVITHFEETITLKAMAEAAGISEWAVSRRFQAHLGTSPLRWVWTFRITLAGECIKLAPDWPLTDISVLAGFTSLAHFSRHFKAHFTETPTSFKNRHIRNQAYLGQNNRDFLFEDLAQQHQDILYGAAKLAITD